jgi:hypothetical protein
MKTLLRTKNILRILALVVILGLFLAPAVPVAAAPLIPGVGADDKIVLGENYVLASGQTLRGNLLVVGGNATLESGAQVAGDVAILGGTLNDNGTITGNIATLGGTVFLNADAVVQGDIALMGGTLHRDSGARVDGKVTSGSVAPFNLSVPESALQPQRFSPLSWWFSNDNPLWAGTRFLGTILTVAALAMLVVLMAPNATARTAQAVSTQAVVAGGIGLLTAVVVPPLLVLLALTLLLIPVSLLGFVILGLASFYGWVAMGLEVGNRTAAAFKTHWHPVAAAGLGALLFTTVMNLIWMVPCLGPAVYTLVGMVGLGAVVVTRFGTQVYPAAAAAGVAVAGTGIARAYPAQNLTAAPTTAANAPAAQAPAGNYAAAASPADFTTKDATPPDFGSMAGPEETAAPDATPPDLGSMAGPDDGLASTATPPDFGSTTGPDDGLASTATPPDFGSMTGPKADAAGSTQPEA